MKKLAKCAWQVLLAVTLTSLSHVAVAYPTCKSAASDPDGDGWGWENNQSCIVQKDSGGGYPACSSAASDPDGDGWGWENNKSCIVQKDGNSGGYPACASAASDPDGDGWGWENNRSCKVTTPPSSCPARAECGSYTIGGLGARKQQILAAGGNSLDVATAMLESDRMLPDYVYGDNKVLDAANFGIFKQNWGMLRVACSRFRNQTEAQWNNGADLNRDLNADIGCLHESQGYYGTERWFAGHRNGSTGLQYPNTEDIKLYRSAVYWIRDKLNAGNMNNDIRFWVKVPAI